MTTISCASFFDVFEIWDFTPPGHFIDELFSCLWVNFDHNKFFHDESAKVFWKWPVRKKTNIFKFSCCSWLRDKTSYLNISIYVPFTELYLQQVLIIQLNIIFNFCYQWSLLLNRCKSLALINKTLSQKIDFENKRFFLLIISLLIFIQKKNVLVNNPSYILYNWKNN